VKVTTNEEKATSDADGRAPVAVWGGVECTIVRVGDAFRDQLRDTGHWNRICDLDLIADLGIRTLRYPVLWEHVAPQSLDCPDWSWHDARLDRLRALGIKPVITLVHHGSGPRYTHLLDPAFAQLLGRYASMVAGRYPWVEMFTPVNEPLTTARFACLYAHWYPHRNDIPSLLKALMNEIKGTSLAMAAIRAVNPSAQLVQTEDLGKTYSTPRLRAQADYENSRRWLTFDLLCGKVNAEHPWYDTIVDAGVDLRDLSDLAAVPCVPDILGINHYLSSDRFLDQRVHRYSEHCWGGNGAFLYADVEARRIDRADIDAGLKPRVREAWARYALPIAVTEVHNGCSREEQVRWLMDAHRDAGSCCREGIDLRAITSWALMGSVDWDSLLTRKDGHYESGAFDARGGHPRPTALAHALRRLTSGRPYEHPILDSPGWWKRDMRYCRPAMHVRAPAPAVSRKILITGASGTLGQAFARICEIRGLDYILTSRVELDVADPVAVEATLVRHRPWAVINAAGYVRVLDAERENDLCRRENVVGPETLARCCRRLGMALLTFSSDLVFDGRLGRKYVETDVTCPTSVYGRSKEMAERNVLAAFSSALIVRSSAFFGPWDKYNFVHRILSDITQGREVAASTTSCVSPTYVPHLVHRALDLLIDGETGIWHLANDGAVSWAELGRLAAKHAGFDPSLITAEPKQGASINTALSTERGSLLPPLASALDEYFRDRRAA
jgi:dTDP-4-dehydrorhamnose reductase